MKIKLIITLTFTLLLVGCATPKYDYSIPPENVKIKHIVQGTHSGDRFYLQKWDTISRPKGDTWLSEEDLRLYYTPPARGDWNEVLKAGLLYHENEHALNQYAFLPVLFLFTNYRWVNEREGYHKQIATYVKYGVDMTEAVQKDLVAVIMNPWYRGMCTEEEAEAFVKKAVAHAKAEFPNVRPVLGKYTNFREAFRKVYPTK